MATNYDNIEETGFLGKKGEGFITASRAKGKDGDESVAMATMVGAQAGGWMELLNDGCENPYPITSEALKTKNTRKNNDSFS